MRNRMYGGVRGRKMKVGGKLLHFPPTRLVVAKEPPAYKVTDIFSFSGGQISIQHNRRCVGKDSENLTQTDNNLGYPWVFGKIVVSLQQTFRIDESRHE